MIIKNKTKIDKLSNELNSAKENLNKLKSTDDSLT